MAPVLSRGVIDTNIALDLLVFADPSTTGLRKALVDGSVHWLVTEGMRDELARVLRYAQIAVRLSALSRTDAQVLDAFDQFSCRVAPAPAAPVRCQDRDDQPFVDLAVEHRACLLSKDRQILRLRRRLALLGVVVSRMLAPDGGLFVAPQVRDPAQQNSGRHSGSAARNR